MIQATLDQPTIRCGSCKGRHASVSDVRNCYGRKNVQTPVEPVPAPVAPVRARLDFSAIPDGNYAIRENGVVKFYRVSTNGQWKNVQVRASDQLYPIRGKAGIAILHQIVRAGLEASQMLFAQELGRCWRCGKSLTDEDSRARGMGPDCAGK